MDCDDSPENWPLSSVEDVLYQERMKHKHKVSVKTVREVLLGLPISIEEMLADEMKATGKGSIVHDAWAEFGDHFFGLFATYMVTRLELDEDGILNNTTKPVISLLSVSHVTIA